MIVILSHWVQIVRHAHEDFSVIFISINIKQHRVRSYILCSYIFIYILTILRIKTCYPL